MDGIHTAIFEIKGLPPPSTTKSIIPGVLIWAMEVGYVVCAASDFQVIGRAASSQIEKMAL